jgi:hypothetical protein
LIPGFQVFHPFAPFLAGSLRLRRFEQRLNIAGRYSAVYSRNQHLIYPNTISPDGTDGSRIN